MYPSDFRAGVSAESPKSATCRRESALRVVEKKLPERSNMPTVLPTLMPEEQAKGGGPERRVQTRFPFTASADVYELRSQTRVNGRCSDLSAGDVTSILFLHSQWARS